MSKSARSSDKVSDQDLPAPPVNLLDASQAVRARKTLVELYLRWRDCFDDLFGGLGDGVSAAELGRSPFLRKTVDDLATLNLVGDRDASCVRSPFRITVFADAFYLSDRPGLNHYEEVFTPFIENYLFAPRIPQFSEGSFVDLGTGCGFLALEMARRGETGLGIDVSQRCIAFSNINASLNSLSDRVRFVISDMTDPRFYVEHSSHRNLIANPPFEAVPPGFVRPLHSDGGPDGAKVLRPLLHALEDSEIQAQLYVVLGSLGIPAVASGEHLLVTPLFQEFVDKTHALVTLTELLPAIAVSDYAAYLCSTQGTDDVPGVSEGAFEKFDHFALVEARLNFQDTNSPGGRVLWRPFSWH